MDSAKLSQLVDKKAFDFDFKTLKDLSTDPFVFVALIEASNGVTLTPKTLFLSERSEIHHRNRPHECLAFAMKLTARITEKIPFTKQVTIKEHLTCSMGIQVTSSQYLIVTCIASNYDDAEWVTSSFLKILS